MYKSHLICTVHHSVYDYDRNKAEKVLIDNGIDPDEVEIVLQAIGYTLLNAELYP